MTRIPRDYSASQLVQALKQFDYQVTRQTGSHLRLTTSLNGEHHITIPNHNYLRVGTLSSILRNIESHLKISKEDLLKKLFD